MRPVASAAWPTTCHRPRRHGPSLWPAIVLPPSAADGVGRLPVTRVVASASGASRRCRASYTSFRPCRVTRRPRRLRAGYGRPYPSGHRTLAGLHFGGRGSVVGTTQHHLECRDEFSTLVDAIGSVAGLLEHDPIVAGFVPATEHGRARSWSATSGGTWRRGRRRHPRRPGQDRVRPEPGAGPPANLRPDALADTPLDSTGWVLRQTPDGPRLTHAARAARDHPTDGVSWIHLIKGRTHDRS